MLVSLGHGFLFMQEKKIVRKIAHQSLRRAQMKEKIHNQVPEFFRKCNKSFTTSLDIAHDHQHTQWHIVGDLQVLPQ